MKNILHQAFEDGPEKMDLTEGSETSAQLSLTPGKYPKESIQKTHKKFQLLPRREHNPSS
jgi:hypothetical protein